MPQVTVEYTKNLKIDLDSLLLKINKSLMSSNQFKEEDIKTRSFVVENYRVGISEIPRDFVHVKIAILSGRDPAVKKDLSMKTLAVLEKQIKKNNQSGELQLTVEILEIERECYLKERL